MGKYKLEENESTNRCIEAPQIHKYLLPTKQQRILRKNETKNEIRHTFDVIYFTAMPNAFSICIFKKNSI